MSCNNEPYNSRNKNSAVVQETTISLFAVLTILAFLGCGAGNHGSPAGRPVAPPGTPAAAVDQQTESDPALIKPGRSVGAIQLGDTREKLIKMLGGKLEEYSHDTPCKD